MTAAELGLLLLRCRLQPDARPLSHAQMTALRQRMRAHGRPESPDAALTHEFLRELGCDAATADNVLALLARRELLLTQLREWASRGIGVLTRLSEHYPQALLGKLGDDAPAVLFYRGDLSLLRHPALGLVGSRDLAEENARFAAAVGSFAARNGYAVVSGNARGADRTAQDACLQLGGAVIVYTAERLLSLRPQPGMLLLSEEVPEVGFTASRALARNRLIHAHASLTFVAQSGLRGGTWSGTTNNLRAGLSPLFLLEDGSEAASQLCALGAHPIPITKNYDEALRYALHSHRETN